MMGLLGSLISGIVRPKLRYRSRSVGCYGGIGTGIRIFSKCVMPRTFLECGSITLTQRGHA